MGTVRTARSASLNVRGFRDAAQSSSSTVVSVTTGRGGSFTGLNGKDLDATEAEVVQAMTALAAGSLTEVALAKWIRERLVRLKL